MKKNYINQVMVVIFCAVIFGCGGGGGNEGTAQTPVSNRLFDDNTPSEPINDIPETIPSIDHVDLYNVDRSPDNPTTAFFPDENMNIEVYATDADYDIRAMHISLFFPSDSSVPRDTYYWEIKEQFNDQIIYRPVNKMQIDENAPQGSWRIEFLLEDAAGNESNIYSKYIIVDEDEIIAIEISPEYAQTSHMTGRPLPETLQSFKCTGILQSGRMIDISSACKWLVEHPESEITNNGCYSIERGVLKIHKTRYSWGYDTYNRETGQVIPGFKYGYDAFGDLTVTVRHEGMSDSTVFTVNEDETLEIEKRRELQNQARNYNTKNNYRNPRGTWGQRDPRANLPGRNTTRPRRPSM